MFGLELFHLLLLPCCKKSKNNKISKGLEAHSIEIDLCKIHCWLCRSRLNVLMYNLEHLSCKEEKRKNLLALYIRLEYNTVNNYS